MNKLFTIKGFRILIIFFISISCTKIAQAQIKLNSKSNFIAAHGLYEISPNGIDSLFHYYQLEFPYLFGEVYDPYKPISFSTEKARLVNFYKGKISTSDLNVLKQVWDNKIDEQVAKIRKTIPSYEQAPVCHQIFIDSLKAIYYPKLSSYRDDLKNAISDDLIIRIEMLQAEAKIALNKKRNDFLEYEKKNFGTYNKREVRLYKLGF